MQKQQTNASSMALLSKNKSSKLKGMHPTSILRNATNATCMGTGQPTARRRRNVGNVWTTTLPLNAPPKPSNVSTVMDHTKHGMSNASQEQQKQNTWQASVWKYPRSIPNVEPQPHHPTPQ